MDKRKIDLSRYRVEQDFYIASAEEALEQLRVAETTIAEVKEYLRSI